MQKDQTFTLEESYKTEVDSQCSCLECDSRSCFVKRQAKEHCGCVGRAPSRLHTHSSQSRKLVTETRNLISKPSTLPEVQIIPDSKNKQVKSSVNVVTRQILSEFVKDIHKNVYTDSTTTIFKVSNPSLSQGHGNSRITSSFTKDSHEGSKKDKGSNVYSYRKKAYREGSENVNPPKDTVCQNMSTTVDHSMPRHDLQAPIPTSKISSAVVPLSAADIYNKIKEAYKACSCEVCECIVGKSLQNEFCKCKPCECSNCANLSECMLSYAGTEITRKHDEQCLCLLCDKKSCKVFDDSERKLQDYHGHHENLELGKFGRDCDCKRCECVKCTARSIHRTLIVAPVGGEQQTHNGCRCAPCECFECRHRYGVTTNGQHEISTGVNRHPHCHCEVCDNEACIPDNSQSCRCVRQSKVMSKPVERDSHDYDIRTAQVTYNKGIGEGNFETLAMFAALPSSYTKRRDQSKECDCDHCECLNCEYSDRTNSQDIFQSSPRSHKLDREVHGKIKYCKPDVLEQLKFENRHVFNMSDCIDCNNLVNACVDESTIKKLSFSHCNVCEIECEKTINDCYKNRGEDASVDIIRLMKSRRQTHLRNNDPLIKSCIDTLESNKKIFQQHELSIHVSKSSTSIDNFGESHHPTCRQVCYGSHRIFCPNFETDSVVHEHISDCANETDLRKHNKQTLNSSLSLLSSKSLVKESESVTPIKNKLKSQESSCNSSGYDYPNYLAHFPKLTIKTCLDNVIRHDLGNNIIFNMSSNNIVTAKAKGSYFNVRDRKSFRSQTITAHSSKQTTLNSKASQTFDYDVQKYVGQIANFAQQKRKTNTLSTRKYKVNLDNDFAKFKTDSASTSTTNTSAKVAFNEEYIRVQKTLREAREYSQHLVNLFEKYEKANREFESVSERIKNSNYHVNRNINNNTNPTNKSKSTFIQEVPTKDSECTFTSAFDEIDTINKHENYIENEDYIHFSEKPVNILKKEIFRGHHDLDYDFIDTDHTKEFVDVYNQKRSNDKKLDERQNHLFKCSRDLNTPQKSYSQSNKIANKQGALTVKNDSDIVPISDSHPFSTHKHFYESLNNKVIDTGKNNDREFHDKSNISQANISDKQDHEKIRRTIEEGENITVKTDFHQITSTTFSKNTNLSTKCTSELINISKSKSIAEKKTESSKLLLENQPCPIINNEKNPDKVKNEERVSLPTPNENDRRAVTEAISHQALDEQATDKSKLKSKSIVKIKTESGKLLLEIVDLDKKSNDGKHEEIVVLPTPHESDEKPAPEVVTHKPVDERTNNSKALEKVQSEVKRILDLPFLQVINNQKKSSHDKNCEALKVTSLVAQRISDHSVAVKWKAPSLFKHVKGYEVLIDGRFVQRITNPSRRMAVISCLPNADKVLLTVRTVVTVPVTDHYPAATLVYHTRKKSDTKIHSRTSFFKSLSVDFVPTDGS